MSKKASELGYNPWYDINELPFNDDQKEIVLEYIARILWIILTESMWDGEYICKSYDPLVIDENTAHSYVLNLNRHGGRHHYFKDYKELEEKIKNGAIEDIQGQIQGLKELG